MMTEVEQGVVSLPSAWQGDEMEHALLVHALLMLACLSRVFSRNPWPPVAWHARPTQEVGLGHRSARRGPRDPCGRPRFEVDPPTILDWLIEVADHAAVFCPHCLHDVRVTQVPLDELFALLSTVKADEVGDTQPPSYWTPDS